MPIGAMHLRRACFLIRMSVTFHVHRCRIDQWIASTFRLNRRSSYAFTIGSLCICWPSSYRASPPVVSRIYFVVNTKMRISYSKSFFCLDRFAILSFASTSCRPFIGGNRDQVHIPVQVYLLQRSNGETVSISRSVMVTPVVWFRQE